MNQSIYLHDCSMPVSRQPLTDAGRWGSVVRGGATPGPGRSYALPLKNWDLALGPACEILIKYTDIRHKNHSIMFFLKFLYSFELDFFCILLIQFFLFPFYPRQYSRICHGNSVYLPVHLLHACFVSKRLNVSSKFFHCLMGPSF